MPQGQAPVPARIPSQRAGPLENLEECQAIAFDVGDGQERAVAALEVCKRLQEPGVGPAGGDFQSDCPAGEGLGVLRGARLPDLFDPEDFDDERAFGLADDQAAEQAAEAFDVALEDAFSGPVGFVRDFASFFAVFPAAWPGFLALALFAAERPPLPFPALAVASDLAPLTFPFVSVDDALSALSAVASDVASFTFPLLTTDGAPLTLGAFAVATDLALFAFSVASDLAGFALSPLALVCGDLTVSLSPGAGHLALSAKAIFRRGLCHAEGVADV